MAENIDIIVVDPRGDLILDIRQDGEATQFHYRVNSGTIRLNSRYFDNLLSDRFSEGQKLSAALQSLNARGYPSAADSPVEELPHISIENIGRIYTQSTIRNLAADFLTILHGQSLPANPPVANLANIAVVADRFDALPYVTKYMLRKKYLQAVDAKSKTKPNTTLSEERVRQKLLAGLLFDHPPWVTKYSKHLMMRDSVQWRPGKEVDDTAASWWDLPHGVEEELMLRREYILETINSLQLHFLKLYSSRERQCKLGYDSSAQCDSFQLGEMVRFFLRLGTIRLQGTIYDTEELPPYSGDIHRLLESLRHVSSYQIDRNHAHCGLRVRIIPLLDLIQNQLNLDTANIDVGLCLDCWTHRRKSYAWASANRPVMWTLSNLRNGSTPNIKGHGRIYSGCAGRHMPVRDMFTAVERDWTTGDVY